MSAQNPNQLQNANESARLAVLNIAYHGLAARIAEGRAAHASNVEARMEHKQVFYSEVGRTAVTGAVRLSPVEVSARGGAIAPNEFSGQPDDDGNLHMSRSWVERRKERRLHKRSDKAFVEAIYADRDAEIFGGGTTLPDRQVRERIAETVFGDSRSGPLSVPTRKERQDYKRFGAPDLPGINGHERTARKASIKERYKAGDITYSEMQYEISQVGSWDPAAGGDKPKYGEKAIAQKGRTRRKAERRLRHTEREEYIWRHREAKLDRAQRRQVRLAKKAVEHRASANAARDRRAAAKQARAQRRTNTRSTP